MKALPVPLALALLLPSCGGGSSEEPACRVNDPVLQYRLHHDDDVSTGHYAPAFSTAALELAVRFDAATLRPVDCGALGGVRFHWWSAVPSTFSVKVYGPGTATAPGALLREQAVTTFLQQEWNVVALDPPVDLPGGDLWIALAYELPGAGWATIGMDDGPKVPGVNFTHQDGTWTDFAWDGNLGIQALVYH
jgi:hypothetical protein